MKIDKWRIVFVLALALFFFAALILFFWDFVRETVVIPIYYLIWLGDLVLKSIPQYAYLGGLVVASILIALNTLRRIRISRALLREAREQPESATRYLFWKKLTTNVYSSPFARSQFAWESRKLLLSILASQEGVSLPEIEVMVRDGRLNVPPSVKSLIGSRELQISERPAHSRDRNSTKYRDPALTQQVHEIISFIEYRLEITHAGKQAEH